MTVVVGRCWWEITFIGSCQMVPGSSQGPARIQWAVICSNPVSCSEDSCKAYISFSFWKWQLWYVWLSDEWLCETLFMKGRCALPDCTAGHFMFFFNERALYRSCRLCIRLFLVLSIKKNYVIIFRSYIAVMLANQTLTKSFPVFWSIT